MVISDLIALLNEARLSPEALALRLRVSNMTYRRWLKCEPATVVPEAYESNIATGIYALLEEGKLSYDSPAVNAYMHSNLPSFFQAAIGQFCLPPDLLTGGSTHQAKVHKALAHIGGGAQMRKHVEDAMPDIQKMSGWGSEWKSRITELKQVIASRKMSMKDKLVAYGALFYLIVPFDLVPDSIPVFGYIDDFGVLGFATAFYAALSAKIRTPHKTV